jgi:hypothetical protein
MKDLYVPIKIKKSIKEKLVSVQGKLMQDLKRKVTIGEAILFLIKYYKY